MTRRGYHHLIMPNGEQHSMVVVLFAADGSPLSWHPLEGEEPFVEWVGGTYRWVD